MVTKWTIVVCAMLLYYTTLSWTLLGTASRRLCAPDYTYTTLHQLYPSQHWIHVGKTMVAAVISACWVLLTQQVSPVLALMTLQIVIYVSNYIHGCELGLVFWGIFGRCGTQNQLHAALHLTFQHCTSNIKRWWLWVCRLNCFSICIFCRQNIYMIIGLIIMVYPASCKYSICTTLNYDIM